MTSKTLMLGVSFKYHLGLIVALKVINIDITIIIVILFKAWTNSDSKNQLQRLSQDKKQVILFYNTLVRQLLVYFLSYITNFVGLLGLQIEFVTATFYQDKEDNKDPKALKISYADVQVILMSCAVMYFLMGCILEYIKRSDLLIALGAVEFMFDDVDNRYHNLIQQLTHIVLATRFALLTIFLIGLAKWFEKKYLYVIIGSWLTNEYLSIKCGQLLILHKGELMVVSGLALIILALMFLRYYSLDPIDQGIIIGEQAIFLTSQHTNQVQNIISVEQFMHESKQVNQSEIRNSQNLVTNSLNQKVNDMELMERRILKRWKIPSLVKILQIEGVMQLFIVQFSMMVLSLIFEIIQTATGEDSLDDNYDLVIFSFQGLILYTQYYMICILGPFNIAKNSQILSHKAQFYTLKGIEMFLSIICIIAMYRLFKNEFIELRSLLQTNNEENKNQKMLLSNEILETSSASDDQESVKFL
ncbi:UNKNOWN [Stylonychia lemnae]|uniref:Transmembrane protein n=1 Tax=Stylonychia lemnae TaxID=5949 RepID=A0A078B579_STYLE|nr:UNKNOWN [Stylonychia lemnae]|eukprot:CDW88417.1 UNKNOWN [Stylonychia lemnae]